jgi:hypothetical protein
MKVLVCHVARDPSVTKLLRSIGPDVALFQSWWRAENPEVVDEYQSFLAEAFQSRGEPWGATVYARHAMDNKRVVRAPHREWLVGVRKATAIVEINGVTFVSFHGFNQYPFKQTGKLEDHLRLVLENLPQDLPSVIGGDFNAFCPELLDTVSNILFEYGFRVDIYDPTSLIIVASRGLRASNVNQITNKPGFYLDYE